MKPALLLACAGLTFADAALAAERKACQMLTVAEWQVRANQYRPVIDGAINGEKVGILIDTGAYTSLIRRSAVTRLGLQAFSLTSPPRGYGVGGATRAEGIDIAELKIGTAVRRNWRAHVVGEHDFGGEVAMLLGDDFFGQGEVEFDMAAGKVRLFKAKDCDRAWLGYWAKDAIGVEFESLDRVHVPVRINGQSMLALFDSGASISTLTVDAAQELGVKPNTPGVVSGGCVSGLGKERYESWIGQFDSFAIGEQVIRNPKLFFAPLWQHVKFEETGTVLRRRVNNLPDMLLGADFLRSHRVLVSYSQRRMYFSYTGGTVFPTEPGKPCSAEKK